jgi:hypothetical protein
VELFERGLERLDSAGIDGAQRIAAQDLNRRALLRSSLGEEQRPVLEHERGENDLRSDARLLSFVAPAKPAGDHQVDHQRQIRLELEHDSFTNSRDVRNRPTLDRGHRRFDRSQDEGTD